MKDVVAINGKVFAPQDAMVSVFDRGFLYGDSVYEVARSYHHIFFALEDHIERLFRSAKRIGLEIGLTPADLIKEIYKVYEQSGLEDAYMRIVVSRGEGPINLDPTNFTHPNIVIIIKALEPAQVSLYSTGMKVVTSTFLRNAKEALDPNIKSGNYLNNILALGEAKKKKADDALLVNREGFVTEGTTWNIFMVKNGAVIGSPDSADILHGITRKFIRIIAQELNLNYREEFFTVEDLQNSDEVFATGTIKEVMAISFVDEVVVGLGKPGAVTLKLTEAYKNHVKSYCERTYV